MSETETTSARVAQAANLFDLRRIIGGVFATLGLLLTILGLTESQAEIDKAAGVNINLWAGLGMLAFALFMIAWAETSGEDLYSETWQHVYGDYWRQRVEGWKPPGPL